jgi:hypothetical protein
MDWNDIATMIGAGVMLVGAFASTPPVFRRGRHPPQQTHLTTTFPIESVRELTGTAAFFAGIVLMQAGVVAGDLRYGASYQWLALATSAFSLLLCGVAIGRLSLRWQLRPEATASGLRTTC